MLLEIDVDKLICAGHMGVQRAVRHCSSWELACTACRTLQVQEKMSDRVNRGLGW